MEVFLWQENTKNVCFIQWSIKALQRWEIPLIGYTLPIQRVIFNAVIPGAIQFKGIRLKITVIVILKLSSIWSIISHEKPGLALLTVLNTTRRKKQQGKQKQKRKRQKTRTVFLFLIFQRIKISTDNLWR